MPKGKGYGNMTKTQGAGQKMGMKGAKMQPKKMSMSVAAPDLKAQVVRTMGMGRKKG